MPEDKKKRKRKKGSRLRKVGLRVAIFIDYANIVAATKRHCDGRRVNYLELRDGLLGERTLVKAKVYVPMHDFYDLTEGEHNFFLSLRSMEYIIVPIQIVELANNTRRGDCDVRMAIDAMETLCLQHLDALILVTGDRDFIPLVERARSMGVKVEVAAVSESASQDLIDASDHFTDIGLDARFFLN